MASSGRKMIIKLQDDGELTFTKIDAVREKSMNKTSEAIDITNDDSDGYRTLFSEPGLRSAAVSISGISDNDKLMGLISKNTQDLKLLNFRMMYPDGAFDDGLFSLTNFTLTGTHNDVVTFESSIDSSGVVTYFSPTEVGDPDGLGVFFDFINEVYVLFE